MLGSDPPPPEESDPVSSPEPPSSQIESDPPSSPVELDPPSSPVELDPPSSPAFEPYSSPVRSCPSSPLTLPSPKRRKVYEFNELEVPHNPMFWPHSDPNSESFELGQNKTEAILHNDEKEVNEGEEIIFNRQTSEEVNNAATLSDTSDSSSVSASSDLGSNDEDMQEERQRLSSSSSSSSQDSEGDNGDDEENVNLTDTDDEDSDSSISDAKIYSDCDLTVREGVLTLMDLFIENKLTKTAMGKIIQSFQKFLPKRNLMPGSKHLMFKYITDRAPPVPVTEHFYCKECLFYIGKQEKKCNLCGGNCKVFYQLCLETQLRNLFEYHNLAQVIDDFTEKRRSKQTEGYSDFCDGSEYKKAHVPGKYNLTLLGHTDGIQISESSAVALWPLEWVLLETPYHFRFHYLIVSGIWVDESHPYMNTFLKPFVDELIYLYEKGVKWTHPKTKKEEISIVVAPVFCADGPVRADIQNILHHGGRYCCHVCEQKMILLPAEPPPPGCDKPPIRRRVFHLQENPSRLRTAERMEAQGIRTLNLKRLDKKAKPIKGVKGHTVISNLPKCDRSSVVYPEYMHLLLGIMRLFLELWFDLPKESPGSLRQHKDKINEFLKNVQVPDFVTRFPRSLDCYSSWKANELRTFLLYLSLIVLKDCMSDVYFQHWMLFVGSMYLLLQECISERDVTKAEILIKMFLRDFSRLYTNKRFTYNLHELSHLPHITRLWGPSYLNSAFWFEGFNGCLTRYIHGTKAQGKELVNTIQLIKGVQVLKVTFNQEEKSMNAIQFLSKVEEYKFSAHEKKLLKDAEIVKPINVYYRAKRKGEIFTSNIYLRQAGINYMVRFKSAGVECFGEIVCFLHSANNEDKKMAFVKKISVDHMKVFFHRESQFVIPHIIPIKETDEVILVPLENILFKVMRVNSYVCVRPNKIEANL